MSNRRADVFAGGVRKKPRKQAEREYEKREEKQELVVMHAGRPLSGTSLLLSTQPNGNTMKAESIPTLSRCPENYVNRDSRSRE